MKEYQARSPDMKSVMCSWPEYDRNYAIQSYRRNYASAPKDDLRHGQVLVLAEWESPDEADRARLDWVDKCARLPHGIKFWIGLNDNIREVIDSERNVPKPKVTVIENPNNGPD